MFYGGHNQRASKVHEVLIKLKMGPLYYDRIEGVCVTLYMNVRMGQRMVMACEQLGCA